MAPDVVRIAAPVGDQARGEALSVFMADRTPIVPSRGHCRFAVSDFDEPWSKSFRAPAAREWLSLEWPGESHHCAAGAARTAKLARRAKSRMPGVKRRPPSSALAGLGRPLLRCLNSGIHAVAVCWRKGVNIVSTPLRACRPRLTASQGIEDQRQQQQRRQSKQDGGLVQFVRQQEPDPDSVLAWHEAHVALASFCGDRSSPLQSFTRELLRNDVTNQAMSRQALLRGHPSQAPSQTAAVIKARPGTMRVA
jgi:hypothetical protein